VKKFTLFLKGVNFSKNQFYGWFLLALCIESCSTMNTAKLEASVDGTKQKFSGPSYPSSSGSKLDPGENIGLLIIAGMSGSYNIVGSSYNNRHSGFNNNPLYASADKGAGSFLNPNGSLAANQSNNFTDNLYFMGGLEFVNKGIDGGGSLAYFQVPLYAMYQYKLDGNAGKVFGGLGPYFSYGVIGSAFSGDDGFKRFDAGLGLTAGYEMPQSLYLRLGFDIGLANIQKNGFGDKAHNSTISLAIGYPLNKLIGKGK
jgi:hypothetical protein